MYICLPSLSLSLPLLSLYISIYLSRSLYISPLSLSRSHYMSGSRSVYQTRHRRATRYTDPNTNSFESLILYPMHYFLN